MTKDMHWQEFATPDECYDILVGYDDLTAKINALKKERDDTYGLSYIRLQQRCSQRKLQASRQALKSEKSQ